MRTYVAVEKGRGQYLVMRLNDKIAKGDKEHYQEYLVDLLNPAMLCSCKHWYYTHFMVDKIVNGKVKKVWSPCAHFKLVISQLEDGGGVIHPDIPGIVDLLYKEVVRNEEDRNDKVLHSKMHAT